MVAQTFPGSTFNYAPGYKQDTAPLINSEYGAVGAGSGDRDISWGFRYLTTQLRKHEKIQGYIFTELTDVEFEHNGFVNYDRSEKEFGYDYWVKGMRIADLQGEDFVGFDGPPAVVAKPGEELSIPAFVSHWSDREGEILLKRWLDGVDDLGREVRIELDSRPVAWSRYRVTAQPPLLVTVPERAFAGAMAMELVDESGQRIAANFVNVVVEPRCGGVAAGQRTRIDARHVAMRVSPRSVSAARWTEAGGPSRTVLRTGPDKFYFPGPGVLEYRFEVPPEVVEAKPVRLGFLVELGTRSHEERLDWPQEIDPRDRPQTDAKKHPGEMSVYINGHPLNRSRSTTIPPTPEAYSRTWPRPIPAAMAIW